MFRDMKKLTTEEFIIKAKNVHGDRYDYSKVNYIDNSTKVCIICPEHGDFWQTPNTHLSGSGCKKCLENNKHYILSYDAFVEKAKDVHGNTYDYSKVVYVNNSTKVCIICPEHGEFFMLPRNHIYNKQGCPKCKFKKLKQIQFKEVDDFINNAKNIHGNKYDYSKVAYLGATQKVCIICPEHGEFWQTPNAHINNKQGCPTCGRLKANQSLRLTTITFIEKSKIIHNDKYDYSKVDYVDYNTPVQIICPVHGEFWQTPDSHLQGKGCRTCGMITSKGENEIKAFLTQHIGEDNFLASTRQIIKPLELDFYIPEQHIAIEYNGIKWHSAQYKDKQYHLNKTNDCKKLNIGLIHIFEDELYNHKEIVFNKIAHILGIQQNLPKIYGRKVEVKNITNKVANDFLDTYHIQGYVASTIHYGAYNNDKLIAVMSFKKERKNNNNWELTRFASDYNYICCGVGGKLFKHFVKDWNPNSVKSFADRRWTINEENNIYCQLGFEFDGYTPPDYKYVANGIIKRQHKFNFRKQVLLKKYPEVLNENMTEAEMTSTLGFYKIYDCGLIKYIWKKEN